MQETPSQASSSSNRKLNKLSAADRPVHDWYRFVLSFPPHLVREYLKDFGVESSQRVLDPFCGTGTTLVECQKQGISSVGIEANPMAAFASRTKINWSVDPKGLVYHASQLAAVAEAELDLALPPLRTLEPERLKLLLKGSISPLPLHKTLVLLEGIQKENCRYTDLERLALAKALVTSIGNLRFGPEVGVGTAKLDVPVLAVWLGEIAAIAWDLEQVHPKTSLARIYQGDARQILGELATNSIDAVITSPPYPNEKDYTRTTRLELVLLGFVDNLADLQAVKRGLIRSNSRGVYKQDDDHLWVAAQPEIQRLAETIEARRIALGKTSGFERLYARTTRLYFGGMARHLADLRRVLRPGAQLAYVVGDQASYLQVMIRTGKLLAAIADSLGYKVVRTDLFRTRLATATKVQLREEVLILRWPGG